MDAVTDDGLVVGILSTDPLVAGFLGHQLEARGLDGRALHGPDAADLAAIDVALLDLGPAPGTTEATPVEGVATLALCATPTLGASALAAGCAGAIDRARDADTLVVAIRAVASGLGVAEPGWSAASPPVPSDSPLTPREQEVLEQLAEGSSNREIGQQLFVSEHTVRFHVRAILEKLGATSRTQAVVFAARAGLLDF